MNATEYVIKHPHHPRLYLMDTSNRMWSSDRDKAHTFVGKVYAERQAEKFGGYIETKNLEVIL